MQSVLGIALFVAGSFVGLKFADFDQAFYWQPLLVHRSLLTHGLLLPLALYLTIGRTTPQARLFTMGFCLSSAVHLCFDLFPRQWSGYALIHLPLIGYSSVLFSFLWVAGSAFVCLHLAARLIKTMPELALATIGLIVSYGVSASREPFPSFFALCVLLTLSYLAFILPQSRRGGDNNWKPSLG